MIRRVQDSVHGLMQFNGMEAIVVDLLGAYEVQRLKRIGQLGMAHQVFPGAEHSRFCHSLGASYLAIKMGRHLSREAKRHFAFELVPDETVIRDMGVAALCHDLGHGPLSHLFEREIVGKDYDVLGWAKKLNVRVLDSEVGSIKWHELVSRGFLGWQEGVLHQRLESQEMGSTERIVSLLRGDYFIPYIPRILDSDVDIDRMDFLKRDTHQTGVQYGRYDIDWIISTATIGKISKPTGYPYVIGFDRQKAFRGIEQFLIARQAMYETVYYHKTVQSAEGMIALFLRKLREVVKEDSGSIGNDAFALTIARIIGSEILEAHELIDLDDYGLIALIDTMAQDSSELDSTLNDLAKRIKYRDLFKQVPLDSNKIQDFLTDGGKEDLEKLLSQYCDGNDPKYYYWHNVSKFEMFESEEEKCGYFVKDGVATRFTESDHFMPHTLHVREGKRYTLFAVREAIDDIVKMIS